MTMRTSTRQDMIPGDKTAMHPRRCQKHEAYDKIDTHPLEEEYVHLVVFQE